MQETPAGNVCDAAWRFDDTSYRLVLYKHAEPLQAFSCLEARSQRHPGYFSEIASVDKCNLPEVRVVCLFFNLLPVFLNVERADGDR